VKNVTPELAPHIVKDAEESISLAHLQAPTPDVYRLDTGDVLGVWVEGVLGESKLPIPVHLPEDAGVRGQRLLPPAAGYPFGVREDGTVQLPMLPPLPVRGLSLSEAELAVRQAYVRAKVLPAGAQRLFVTLLQRRWYEVVVLRQESRRYGVGAEGAATAFSKQGAGFVINLSAGENDVLHALALTGGLPGLDVYNSVVVLRRLPRGADRQALFDKLRQLPPGAPLPPELVANGLVVRLPLRLPPGEPLPFQPRDVMLQTGDVVFLEARDKEVFYTAGLLPAGEHILPRDRDLDVVAAVALVRGPMVNSTYAGSTINGTILPPGLGQPSASLLVVLRRTPGGGQMPIRVDLHKALRDPSERILVRPGDLLVLQEKPTEALARYASQTADNFIFMWQPIHTRWLSGFFDMAGPDRILGRGQLTTFQPFVQGVQQVQQQQQAVTGTTTGR
jgi:protein involved in polysaccharide export with SLBB domain